MDLYSVRNEDNTLPLIYDHLPLDVRVKVIRLWWKITSKFRNDEEAFWYAIKNMICDQHGVHELVPRKFRATTSQHDCRVYFEKTAKLEECFDIIEIVMGTLKKVLEEGVLDNSTLQFEDWIYRLNKIFRDSDIGYEYTEVGIIRTDNKLLHQEIIE